MSKVTYELIGSSIFGASYQCSGCEFEPEETSFTWVYCPSCGEKIAAFEQDEQLDLDFEEGQDV